MTGADRRAGADTVTGTIPTSGISVPDTDLTAKARIRNAALELYARHGEDGVSMRAVAAAAGVTVGLVQHHFGNKDGLREAVEALIVDFHVRALATAPQEGDPAEVARLRNAAVQRMLDENPAAVDYMRRVLLNPASSGSRLLARLTELSRSEITKLRAAGLASAQRSESEQTIGLMVRQVGQLFLQPMVDAMWEQLDGPAGSPADGDALDGAAKPILRVRAETP